MSKRLVFGCCVMLFAFSLPGFAGGKDELQKYFNDVAYDVKTTPDPAQKREILSRSFRVMSDALDEVQNSPLVAKDEIAGIALFKASLKEKQDELAGLNGYERVSDQRLNAFSDFVVQDMAQASETVTISLVALLLIIIIALLV